MSRACTFQRYDHGYGSCSITRGMNGECEGHGWNSRACLQVHLLGGISHQELWAEDYGMHHRWYHRVTISFNGIAFINFNPFISLFQISDFRLVILMHTKCRDPQHNHKSDSCCCTHLCSRTATFSTYCMKRTELWYCDCRACSDRARSWYAIYHFTMYRPVTRQSGNVYTPVQKQCIV